MSAAIPETITSARVRAIYDYWNAKRGGRCMPARADIEPADIKAMLPYLLLTDLHRDPLRVRFRLIGTRVVEAARTDLTGQWLHEADLDGNNVAWEAVYRRVGDWGAPVFGETRAVLAHGDTRRFQWVVLPLSDGGESASQTLELEDWEMLRLLSREDVERAEWTLETFV